MIIGTHTLDGIPFARCTKGSEKRVAVKCDTCGKESETHWANYFRAQQKRDGDGFTQCKPCGTVASGKAKLGRPNLKLRGLFPHRQGKNNTKWTGGRRISTDGYWIVYVRRFLYRKEHILFMEERIGRPLDKEEIVHHVDGDKLNNDDANLYLVSNNTEHKALHQQLQHIAYELIREGRIGFKDGRYFRNETDGQPGSGSSIGCSNPSSGQGVSHVM